MDTLPSEVLQQVGGFRSALAVSCFRFRARLGFSIPTFFPRPARHYPRFRIWHPSSGCQRDFNPPELRAAQRTLRRHPTDETTSHSTKHDKAVQVAGYTNRLLSFSLYYHLSDILCSY